MKFSNKMKLKKHAQEAILENNDLRLDIAKELNHSEGWIRTLAQNNSNNGRLTALAALQIIAKCLKTEINSIITN